MDVGCWIVFCRNFSIDSRETSLRQLGALFLPVVVNHSYESGVGRALGSPSGRHDGHSAAASLGVALFAILSKNLNEPCQNIRT